MENNVPISNIIMNNQPDDAFDVAFEHAHGMMEDAQDGVALLSGLIALGTLAISAKAKGDQQKELTNDRNWKEYEEPASDRVVSSFFINDKLALDQLFSRRINSHNDGKALKLVETALYMSLKKGAENKQQIVALMGALYILRDYQSIAFANQSCKRGTRYVLAQACLILKQERGVALQGNEENTVLSALPEMYAALAQLLNA